MLHRNAGWAVRFVCIGVLMTGPLGHPVDYTNNTRTESPKITVRQSHALSSGEQEFILKRKRIVLQALNRLGINSTLESVPHIALLVSGGGQRSAVSLIGLLCQMKQDDMLDTLLYLAAVSGSTWTVSLLYSDPGWSSNMDSTVSRLAGPREDLKETITWLKDRAEKDDFSLTDVWGFFTGVFYMQQMDMRNLTDDANRLSAINPYPIYNAIERNCFHGGSTDGKWFEVTPHESGFVELGLYINTSSLDSGLQGGLTVMDIVRLNGIMSSAPADQHTVYQHMPRWMQAFVRSALTEKFSIIDAVLNWMDQAVPLQGDTVLESLMDSLNVLNNYMRVYHTVLILVDVIRMNIQDPTVLARLDILHKELHDKLSLNPWPALVFRSQKEKEKLLMDWSEELIKPLERWCESLKEGPFKEFATFIIKSMLPHVGKWEWGTTNNFLYNYKDPAVPSCLTSQMHLNLIDAGLFINAPYVPFLGERRDIDLMIAPDCSAGDVFETLTLARDYAAEVKKPFPEIDENVLKEKDWPKDCYVFEGKQNQPTVIYMPLFNQKNCKDAEEFRKLTKEYATIQLPLSQKRIDNLLKIAKANIENNREKILNEISKAAQRRLQRIGTLQNLAANPSLDRTTRNFK